MPAGKLAYDTSEHKNSKPFLFPKLKLSLFLISNLYLFSILKLYHPLLPIPRHPKSNRHIDASMPVPYTFSAIEISVCSGDRLSGTWYRVQAQ
ncbi:MAG: hypothetical protein PHH49_08435, partial [Candidatus Omnitrophica bacterium]|nr:hypothetical protein [Candidatus Omnitrophota bacterium]